MINTTLITEKRLVQLVKVRNSIQLKWVKSYLNGSEIPAMKGLLIYISQIEMSNDYLIRQSFILSEYRHALLMPADCNSGQLNNSY